MQNVTSKQQFQRGFTLLEIMVVVTIIALMASAVIVTLGDNKPDTASLRNQRAQLSAALRNMAQSSMLNQQWQGVYFEGSAYQSVVFSDNLWQKSPDTEAKQIADDIPFVLLVDDQIIDTEEKKYGKEHQLLLSPQIMVSPVGIFNSFELRFGAQQLPEDSLSDPYATL